MNYISDMFNIVCIADLSSASEVSDNDSDDSDSRDLSGYACRHCYTTSKSSFTSNNYGIDTWSVSLLFLIDTF